MNDVQKADLRANIINRLLIGQNPDMVSNELDCDLSLVLRIMGSSDFLEQISENLRQSVQVSGLQAVRNIKNMADDDTISATTRLKANQWLADNALNINELGATDESPATMSQNQLAKRLKLLQDEAIKRAKPIDTGVIEHNPPSIDDMME